MVPSASDHLVAAHADAVVLDGECFLSGSALIVMRGFGSSPSKLGTGYRLVAQLLAGVRRVRDQFAQEDILVRIDRMHHQVQQPRDVSFECSGFRRLQSASFQITHPLEPIVRGTRWLETSGFSRPVVGRAVPGPILCDAGVLPSSARRECLRSPGAPPYRAHRAPHRWRRHPALPPSLPSRRTTAKMRGVGPPSKLH